MQDISKSAKRGTFQKEAYIARCIKDGIDLASPEAVAMISMYNDIISNSEERENTPEWQEDNMEYDLRTTDWILEKVRADNVYAQNLYAGMCNTDFQKIAVMPILKNQRWSCSWRHAGGIVADMQEKGDYIDWYCTGIKNNSEDKPEEWDNWTLEQQTHYKEVQAYVGEGVVTDEIREDLKKLGWRVCPDSDDSFV
jgi:hypothetical protein